ncbi:MAG TPA: glycosyltransferase [Ktedonobacterales bacterium]|jgi:glycosyltransferase involved in cell wall biosynthesis
MNASDTTRLRLRILHVITGLEIGGAERVLLETARYQQAHGHEVAVCALRPEGPLASAVREVCPLYTVDMGHRLSPGVIWKLARLMRRGRYDVVHSYLYQANLVTRVAARLAGVPVNISSVRCSYTWLRWPHFAVDRWTAHFADCITSVSEATRQFSIEREGLPAGKIVTLRNGIEVSRFDKITDREATRAATRQSLGYASDDLVVCMTGRLHAQKGHTYLFQVAERLKARFPHLRLLIIGDGPQRGALEAEAQARGLNDLVQFLGMRKDVPELLAASDIFAFPSLYEGLPNAVLEAMAMSLPVVASTADGTVEVIENERDGLLVPTGDAAALEVALERVLGDAELRQRFAQAGRQRVLADFTFEKMMRETEDLYYSLLGSKAPERLTGRPLEPVATGGRG